MTFRPTFFSLATLWAIGTGLCNAAPNPVPPLFCDSAEYPPRQLTWNQSGGLKQVNNIFPHPLLPQRALAACDSGLCMSNDAGKTWAVLSQGSTGKIGAVQSIAFHPAEPETFYIASATKGVWVTEDAGQSFQQIGSAAGGMATDATVDIIVYSGDPGHETLLAVHGSAAGGVSRTRNSGKTWDILNPEYCFRRILGHEKNSSEVLLYGSTKTEPDIQTLFSCATPSELPVELMRDTVITDFTFAPVREPAPLYVATASGLYRINPAHDVNTLLGKKDESWASISAIWGPNADSIGLCLYDPSRRGLVFSNDELASTQTCRGPLVSALVKEGASVRPNANGTIFYAVANGTLTIGSPSNGVPVVSVTPPAFEPSKEDANSLDNAGNAFRDFPVISATSSAAKAATELRKSYGDLAKPYRQTQITIAARVLITPEPPSSVTVDLSRLGGSATTPLYDDGKHDDGAAGDGVYGLTFCFKPLAHAPSRDDWRRSWPGRIALGVTASYGNGQRQGAVAVVGIYPKIQSYDLWWSRNFDSRMFSTSGDVTAEAVPPPPENPRGGSALRIKTGKGPWSVFLRAMGNNNDITGYQALTFRIKADEGALPDEIYVQLCDRPELTAPVSTERFALIAQGMREAGIDADFRRAVLPFSSLLSNNTRLETSKIDSVILSGDGGTPGSFCIDGPRILASIEEADPSNNTPAK